MRQWMLITALFCIIIAFTGSQIFAENPRFSLLQPDEYHLNTTMSTGAGRLYVQAKFAVNQDSLIDTEYYSFFLNKDAYLERVYVNGKIIPYTISTNLDPMHFVPELQMLELIDTCAITKCYSIGSEYLKQAAGSIDIEVCYRLPLPEWEKNDLGEECLSFVACDFWYPRNVYEQSEINVTLTTTVFYKVERSSSVVDEGSIRTIKKTFIDIPGEVIPFSIIKSLN